MLYQFVKPLARWILGWNFQRIYISGKEKLPKKGAIILACNHPSAFIEPCVLASFQNRPLHFLVRGDFFRKKIFSFFLRVLHMIPIFRMKDGGYSQIKNNLDSFQKCYEALNERKALMILAEGFCIHEKKLRPIRKGTARIAFGALDKYDVQELLIFPIGVNYTDVDNYRSDLMMHIGDAIKIEDYIETFQKDKPEAVRQLTAAIEEGLSNHVVQIKNEDHVQYVENIWEIWRNEGLNPSEEFISDSGDRLKKEKSISDAFNNLDDIRREEVISKLDEYFSLLNKNGVKDLRFSNSAKNNFSTLVLVLGFPFFLVGALFNFMPILCANLIGKLPGLSIEFRQSLRVASALGFFMIWYLILIFICFWINPWLSLIICILLPLSSWFCIRYLDHFKSFRKKHSGGKLSSEKQEDILHRRNQIVQTLTNNNLWA